MEYSKYMAASTSLALDFIDIDEESYEASFKEAASNPEIALRLKRDEDQVRLRVEKPREITESREEIKHIIC